MDKNEETVPSKPPKKKKKIKWTRKRILILSGVTLILLVGGGIFLYDQYTYETTDDAMVAAHTTLLGPKVTGIVTQVLVDENQFVKAGQLLVKLEQKDFVAALQNARASLQAIQVQANNARTDYLRASKLFQNHVVTHQSYDHARATYENLDGQAKASQASVEQALLNLEYTRLRAPTDGFISRKSVEVGMNAGVGAGLLGFVQTDQRWIIANYKETQLKSIQIGKSVKVKIDALPKHDYEGIVESISPSSGATFTLFPPDNATGNFTKVVQRVPVKIYLKNLKPEDRKLLQAGLSAEVSVVKHSEIQEVPENQNERYISQIAQSLPENLPDLNQGQREPGALERPISGPPHTN